MRTFDEYKKGEERAIFDAVWQYLLDHAELTNDGTLFVKFHTKDKQSFRQRISARMKGVYRNGQWMQKIADERRKNVLEQGQMQSAINQLKNQIPHRPSILSRIMSILKR